MPRGRRPPPAARDTEGLTALHPLPLLYFHPAPTAHGDIRSDMTIYFSKMHGLGNDFVVIDGITQPVTLSEEQVRFLADRRLGVGCDQVLMVAPAGDPAADFRYRIYNADGSEAEQCGNGARCFARFVRRRGLTDKDDIVIEARAGLMRARIEDGNLVTVEMGVPHFDPGAVPFRADAEADSYTVDVDGEQVEIGVLSLGNPHGVLLVEDVTRAPVIELGRRIESHPRFPQRVNVGFMEVQDRTRVRLRVYERGVGETLACGSGACAAMVSGHRRGVLDERVAVELPGGHLFVQWSGAGTPVTMTGPATHVFEGAIDL